MWGNGRSRIALLTLLLFTLAVPSTASAALTVGQTFSPIVTCTSFTTYVQSESTSSQYTVPSDGVVTSWSHQAGPVAASLKFKVLSPAGGTVFDVAGESDLTELTVNQLNSNPVRIPVQAGDVIGAFFGAGPNPLCGVFTGGAGDSLRSTVGDVTGSGIDFNTFLDQEGRINLSARLEPDADEDGFGDETQDQCASDPSTQGACPTPARIGKVKVSGPSKVKKGSKPTYRVKISNTGGLAASGVKVKVSGKGLSGTGSARKIAAGKSKTVSIRLKPKKPGKIKATFKVTSANAGSKASRRTITVKK